MLTALLLLPLLGALLLFFWKYYTSAKYIALLFGVAQMLLTWYVAAEFNYSDAGLTQTYFQLSGIGASARFGIDGLSLIMVLLTNTLIPFVIASTWNQAPEYPSSFFALILLMQFGLLGVFTSMDGLMFYIFWEVTLIPIWFICGIWGQESKRIRVTLKFFVYTFFGSLFMLVGLIFLYFKANGSFDLNVLYALNLNETDQIIVFWLIFIAFAVKLPLFPFHTWQADTYTVSPTQGSMLLSGIMLKMAIFGMLRYLWPIVPDAVAGVSGKLVLIMAICGIIHGALVAIVHFDVKRILAYSSLSHVGLIVAGIASTGLLSNESYQGIQGALVQSFAHGVNIVGLFYCVDILIKRFGTRDLRAMGGLAIYAPKFASLFLIILLGATAVPLTNGFIGEFILLKSVYTYNIWAGIISGVSIILTAVYMLRLYSKSMFGDSRLKNISDRKLDLSGAEFGVLASLSILVLVMGVAPQFVIEMANDSLQIWQKLNH